MAFSATFQFDIVDRYSRIIQRMSSATTAFRLNTAIAGDAISKFGGKMSKASTALANLRTGFAAAMLTRGLRSAAAESFKFEKALNKVEAVTQASASQMLKLRQRAREMGLSTKFSSVQAAEGMAMLGQRGFDTAQILATLPSVLTMATAGDIDLAAASSMATGTMYAFELGVEKASHIADVYALTASNTASSMQDLNAAMTNAAPLAHAAGISFEETAALVGIMSNKNIRGGASGTLLMNAFRNLIKPTREAIDVLKDFGFKKDEVTDAAGQIVDFTKLLELFEQRGIGVGEIFKIFQIRGAKGTAALMGQTEAVRKLIKAYQEQSGAAQKMAAIMRRDIVGQTENAISAWEGLKEALGKALEPATKVLLKMVTGFSKFIAAHPKVAKVLGTFMALAAILLTIVTIAGIVIAAIGGIALAVGAVMGTAIAGGTVAVITGIVIGILAIVSMIVAMSGDIWEIIKLSGTLLKALGAWLLDKILWPFKKIYALAKKIKGFFGGGGANANLTTTMIGPDDLTSQNKIVVENVIKGSIEVNDRTGGNVTSSGGGGVVPINVQQDNGYGDFGGGSIL